MYTQWTSNNKITGMGENVHLKNTYIHTCISAGTHHTVHVSYDTASAVLMYYRIMFTSTYSIALFQGNFRLGKFSD